MNVLGIRCSNKDFAYVVMSGTRDAPTLVESNFLKYPKSFSRARKLLWLSQEIEQVLQKHMVDTIVMKRFEGPTRGTPFEERAECEGCVYLTAAKCGVKGVLKKMNSTIAKDLGMKGRAHYLKTHLDTSLIPSFTQYSDKEKEAILCAWSDLK